MLKQKKYIIIGWFPVIIYLKCILNELILFTAFSSHRDFDYAFELGNLRSRRMQALSTPRDTVKKKKQKNDYVLKNSISLLSNYPISRQLHCGYRVYACMCVYVCQSSLFWLCRCSRVISRSSRWKKKKKCLAFACRSTASSLNLTLDVSTDFYLRLVQSKAK